jgi:hypothetical protein
MVYGTTGRENKMTSAAFYIGMGAESELVATAAKDAAPADMDDRGLFGPADTGEYTEVTFLEIAGEAQKEAGKLKVHTAPDMAYVFKNGSVLVFERVAHKAVGIADFYQVALHYPNGARRPQHFPEVV